MGQDSRKYRKTRNIIRLNKTNFSHNPWGGQWIPRMKKVRAAAGIPVGESWEFSTQPHHANTFLNADGRRQSIRSVVKSPILIKLIDAADNLSVQVHPSDAYAKKHERDSGKAESWIVLNTKADGQKHFVYLGFRQSAAKRFAGAPHFRRAFEAAIHQANQLGPTANRQTREKAAKLVLPFLNKIPVRPGDVFDVPPGTIHAIGAGVRLFEIQQTSDVTYRIWDWNRIDLGKLKRGKKEFRTLHLKEAFDVLDFKPHPVNFFRKKPHLISRSGTGSREEKVFHEPKNRYAVNRLFFDQRGSSANGFCGRHFLVLTAVNGQASVYTAQKGWTNPKKWGLVSQGETLFFPARLGCYRIVAEKPGTEIFKSYVPI